MKKYTTQVNTKNTHTRYLPLMGMKSFSLFSDGESEAQRPAGGLVASP